MNKIKHYLNDSLIKRCQMEKIPSLLWASLLVKRYSNGLASKNYGLGWLPSNSSCPVQGTFFYRLAINGSIRSHTHYTHTGSRKSTKTYILKTWLLIKSRSFFDDDSGWCAEFWNHTCQRPLLSSQLFFGFASSYTGICVVKMF